jgi:hypothetical protein
MPAARRQDAAEELVAEQAGPGIGWSDPHSVLFYTSETGNFSTIALFQSPSHKDLHIGLHLAYQPRGGIQIMRKWLWIAPVMLLAAGCSRTNSSATAPATPGGAAATTSSAAAVPSSPAPAPAAPVRNTLVIPSGTPFHVRLDTEVDTKHNRAGDGFTATLSQPLVVEGQAVLPVGTRFSGHITTAGSSGRLKGRAAIGLTLDSFEHEGRRYQIRTTSVDRVSAAHKKRNAVLIGGGTGLGAAIGALAGGPKGALIGAGAGAAAGTAGAAATGKRQVAVPSEALLRFTLRAPVEIG